MSPAEVALFVVALGGTFVFGLAMAAVSAYRQRTDAYRQRTAVLGDTLGRIASSATSLAYQRYPMPVSDDCANGCVLRRAKANVAAKADLGSGGAFR